MANRLDYLADIAEQNSQGAVEDPEFKPVNTTLPELGERYIEYAKLHKRSWKRDVQMLAKLQAFFGPAKLRDITPFRVEEYQRERVKEVCPATSNCEMALLKHMFSMADRWGQHQGSAVHNVPAGEQSKL